MKKLLIYLFIVFVSVNYCFAQESDVLQYALPGFNNGNYKSVNVAGTPCYKIDASMYRGYEQNDTLTNFNITYVATVPEYVWDDYVRGDHMYKSGISLSVIGALSFLAGGVLTGIYYATSEKPNPQSILNYAKAGAACMSIGGVMLSVSIPLTVAGSCEKRSTNRDYKMFRDRNKAFKVYNIH